MQPSMHSLSPLFNPRSVAIVGASNDPNKVGGRPLAFLRRGGWDGLLLPVNPQATEVQGLPAHASLQAACDATGGVPDQVIVAVPPAQVLPLARDCAHLGVRALQIFSAGFGEGTGEAGARAQAELRALVRAGGMRVLGPNSLGLFNTAAGYYGTFATALDGAWPQAGSVGVATQSGAFGSYFFGMAQAQGLGFSHFVATGNEADVDVADCVDWLVHDSATRLIVMAMEGCREGRKLARALQAARAAGKPVLAMKVGTSAAGAQAAATHTGSLTGEDRVFDAVLRDSGARRLDSLQSLVDAACVATIGPLPTNRELLIVTTSGGIGVLAADAAEHGGLALPGISDAALADVRAIAPLADGRNPVDTSAGILGDLSAYARIAQRALADQPVGAVLCFLAHITRNPAHWAQLRGPLFELRAAHAGIPFVAVALADADVTADLRAHGFTVFSDPTHAVRALAVLAPQGRLPSDAMSRVHSPAEPADLVGTDGATDTQAARLAGPLDTESAAKQALAAHGIRFAPEAVVHDANAAVQAARRIGWPVVLKVVSPDIAHKTEVGGVRLGIEDDAALRQALADMQAQVRARQPDARIDGWLVARQLSGGVEVLVGTQCDPVFGPVVAVGWGGVMAELMDDVRMALAPVTAAQARELLGATRVGRLLQGWRGASAADMDTLATQIETLSQLAWAHRDQVHSIDLNPVLALPDGAFAVDALVVTRPAHADAPPAAALAAHPGEPA